MGISLSSFILSWKNKFVFGLTKCLLKTILLSEISPFHSSGHYK